MMESAAFIATGIPQLDLILGGGIVPNSVLLIVGPSGSGKTILTSQIACAMAARNERVILITTFSNPHNKLITNLRRYQFFNPDYIGERIQLFNLQHQLMTSPDEAATTIVHEAREQQAQYVLIDNFQNFQSMYAASDDVSTLHQASYDLSAKLNMLGVTTVMGYELPSTAGIDRPEFAVVDTVLMLAQEVQDGQVVRTLRVIKHRGMKPLLGQHTFTISNTGLTFYPRQETLAEVHDVPVSPARLPFGIPMLDQVLDGGLNQGTSTLLAGVEGVGKTALGLQYAMHGVDNGNTALFITFYETPQQLIAKAQAIGLDIAAAIRSERLLISYYLPVELNPDRIGWDLRDAVVRHDLQRVVIDGVDELERLLIKCGRGTGFWASLLAFLRRHQTTTCMTTNTMLDSQCEPAYGGAHLFELVDNLLVLRRIATNDRYTRSLSVLKMRFSNHDYANHPYTIGAGGFSFDEQVAM